jgi:hypothetical protein
MASRIRRALINSSECLPPDLLRGQAEGVAAKLAAGLRSVLGRPHPTE